MNALSNAKRALHFQVELVAGAFELDCDRIRNFPPRIEFCQRCGVVGPRVLSKLNRVRNAVEHDYVIPTRNETEDFVDVVELFLAATDRFIFQFPLDLEFLADPTDPATPEVSHIELKPGTGVVTLRGTILSRIKNLPEGWTDDGTWSVHTVPCSDDEYFAWVQLLVKSSFYT